MKPLSLFLTLLAVSCAAKPPPVVKVQSTPSRTVRAGSGVRFPERIKAYPLGRYVEPNHRGVMHEAHTIYRIEATPKWDLSGRAGAPRPAPPEGGRTCLSRNELLVALNRQREATQSVIQSGQSVSSKLTDLATSLQKNQQALAGQNAEIRQELESTRRRLETLESKTHQPPERGASSSDDAPW
jgi:hypothetical protein